MTLEDGLQAEDDVVPVGHVTGQLQITVATTKLQIKAIVVQDYDVRRQPPYRG
jgi:hypothetical protein